MTGVDVKELSALAVILSIGDVAELDIVARGISFVASKTSPFEPHDTAMLLRFLCRVGPQ